MNSSKVISAAAVIFLAGAATGALVTHHWTASPITGKESSIPDLVDRLDQELTLSDDQRIAIQRWLQGSLEHMGQLRQRIEPQANAELIQLREHIRGELTASQCDKFETVFKVKATQSAPDGLPKESPPKNWPPQPLDAPPSKEKPSASNQPWGRSQGPGVSSHGWSSSHPTREEQPAEANSPVDGKPLSSATDAIAPLPSRNKTSTID